MLEILHLDELMVAVDKPAGLLVHRTGLDAGETRFALQLLRDQLGRHVWPVHRLDKGTSGVLLFALDAGTAGLLGRRFEAGAALQRPISRWCAAGRRRRTGRPSAAAPGGARRGSDEIGHARAFRTLARHRPALRRFPTTRCALLELSRSAAGATSCAGT
jgi:tRNA pseudouridine65 synthase